MSAAEANKIKGLETLKSKLSEERNQKVKERQILDNEINRLMQKVKSMEDEIRALKLSSSEPVVTEHAMLRYLDRVMGLDLEELTQKILSGHHEKIKKMKSGKIKAEGITLVIKDCAVVTVETQV